MYIFLSILIVLACLLLIGAVLIQKSKGADSLPTILKATSISVIARPPTSLKKQPGRLQSSSAW